MTSVSNPSARLFVGSLPYRFTEGQLLSLFVPFGRVIAVSIIHNQWGKSRGLGFVEFDNSASAVEAKNKLHNSVVDDRTIIVDFYKPDPFLTPEGQQRHFQKQSKSPQFKNFTSPPTPRTKRIRQSVFDSRHHGAHTGRKFAARTKKKK